MSEQSASTQTPSERRRALFALLAAVALALAATWLVVGGGLNRFRPSPQSAGLAEVGQPAPDFCLETVPGGQACLADYRGQVVLLNFWATWCVPCRAEMPELQEAYRHYQQRGFQVLAINLQEGPGEVEPFMQELGLTFPALLDRDGALSRQYLVRALPASLLIDRQGKIALSRLGPLTSAMLGDELRRLGF
jgi:peroxiredoxin